MQCNMRVFHLSTHRPRAANDSTLAVINPTGITSISGAQVKPLFLLFPTLPPPPFSPPTNASSHPATKAANDVEKWLSTKTTDPAYIAAQAAFTSAIPDSVITQIDADPSKWALSIINTGAIPDWVRAVPASALRVQRMRSLRRMRRGWRLRMSRRLLERRSLPVLLLWLFCEEGSILHGTVVH